jgi:signal transduction histidine kinase
VVSVLTDCLLGFHSLFEKKGINPQVDLPDHAVMIVSNTQALERIFQNLFQNALRYAIDTIGLSLSAEGIFTITNNTEVLTVDDTTHLFERFYTADRSRSTGGSGLGLYIVKRLLEKTHGTIGATKLENGFFCLEIVFRVV